MAHPPLRRHSTAPPLLPAPSVSPLGKRATTTLASQLAGDLRKSISTDKDRAANEQQRGRQPFRRTTASAEPVERDFAAFAHPTRPASHSHSHSPLCRAPSLVPATRSRRSLTRLETLRAASSPARRPRSRPRPAAPFLPLSRSESKPASRSESVARVKRAFLASSSSTSSSACTRLARTRSPAAPLPLDVDFDAGPSSAYSPEAATAQHVLVFGAGGADARSGGRGRERGKGRVSYEVPEVEEAWAAAAASWALSGAGRRRPSPARTGWDWASVLRTGRLAEELGGRTREGAARKRLEAVVAQMSWAA